MPEPTVLVCPHCQLKLRLPAGTLGNAARCPGCRQPIGPAASDTAPTARRPASPGPPPVPVDHRHRPGKAPPRPAQRYGAFISYRHIDPDRRWARWLQIALETYRVPARLVREQKVPARVGRVFRDEEELAAAADLGVEIRSALDGSAALVVVCSPRTPESEWVNKEVEYFRSLGRHDRILALLVDGEPADAFPRALRDIRPVADGRHRRRRPIDEVEPLAADVRRLARESRRQLKRVAKLRLVAALLRCRYDDLRRREAERRKRQLAAFGSVVAVLLVVLMSLGAYALHERGRATRARQAEEKSQALADERGRLADERGKELDTTASKLNLTAAERNEESFYRTLLQAEREIGAGNLAAARTLLETKVAPEFRGWECDYLLRRTVPGLLTLRPAPADRPGLFREVVAASPDGLRVAAPGPDEKSVQVWDSKTGQEVLEVGGFPDPVEALAYSPDGRWLAVSSKTPDRDGAIQFVDSYTGKPGPQFRDLGSTGVGRIAFAPDGRAVAAAFHRRAGYRVIVWDVTGGRELLNLELGGSASNLAFSASGRWLAATTENFQTGGTVRIWDAATGKPVQTVAGPPKTAAFHIAFDAGGDRLAWAAAGDGKAEAGIMTLPDGTRRVKFEGVGKHIGGLAFTLDGRHVAGLTDAGLRLWDAAAGIESRTLHDVGGAPLVMLPDGERFVTGGPAVRVWALNPRHEREIEIGGLNFVHAIAFSPDKKHLGLATSHGEVRVLDVATGRLGAKFQSYLLPTTGLLGISQVGEEMRMSRLPGTSAPMNALAFTPDGRGLVAGGGEDLFRTGELYVWDLPTRQLKFALKGHKKPVRAVAVSPNGAVVASASDDTTVRLWDAETGAELHVLGGHQGPVRSIGFRPDGRLLVSGGDDKTVRVWDVTTGTGTRVIEGHTAAVNTVAYSPKGDRIASAGKDGTLRAWEAESGRAVFATTQKDADAAGQAVDINSLAFAPDGTRIATSGPATVRLCDARTGREVLSFRNGSSVQRVAFSPDGKVLTAGGWPKMILRDAAPADAATDGLPAARDAVRRGDVAFAAGDFRAAAREYDAAAAADPAWADPPRRRGNARARLGEDPRADYRAALAAETEAAIQARDFTRALNTTRAARVLAPADAEVVRREGRALVRAGRPADALAAFDEALRLRPKDVRALAGRGLALTRLKDHAGALAAYDAALAIAPTDAEALDGRVLVLELLGRPKEAAEANAKLLAAHPGHPMALCRQGRDAAAQKKWAAADAAFHEAASRDPSHWAPPYALSVVLRDKGELQAATDQASAAIERRPDAGHLYGTRASVFWAHRESQKAIVDCTTGLTVDPADAALWEQRGTYLVAVGDPEFAVRDLTEAIRLNPTLTTARTNRAATYCNTVSLRTAATLATALADFSEVVRLRPADPTAHSNRAAYHLLVGDYRKAVVDLDEAIRLSPAVAAYHESRGSAWAGLGENAKALADFDRSIELAPTAGRHLVARGRHLAARQQWDRALADLDAAVRLDPKNSEALAARGVLHHNRGQKKQSAADVAEAKRLNPRLAATSFQAGSDELARGQYARAADEFTAALLLDPTLHKAWHDRGVCRVRLERFDDAVADFSESIRLQPKHAMAYKNRGAAYAARKEFPKAVADFTKVIELTKDGGLGAVRADALTMRAEVHRETGKVDDAIRDYTELLNSSPSRRAYTARAELYRQKGDAKKAADDLARAAAYAADSAAPAGQAGPPAPAIENYLPRDYSTAVLIRPVPLVTHPLMKDPPPALKLQRDTLFALAGVEPAAAELVDRTYTVITAAGVVHATALTRDIEPGDAFGAGSKATGTYRGVKLWQSDRSHGCMPHPRVIVAATTEKGVREALDRAASKPAPFDVPADADVVIRVKDVRAVSEAMKAQQGKKPGKDDLPTWAKAIKSITGTIRLGPAVDVEVVLDAGTAAAARTVVDKLNPQIAEAAAAMRAEKYKPGTAEALIAAWVDALKFTVDDRYGRFATTLDAKTGHPAWQGK